MSLSQCHTIRIPSGSKVTLTFGYESAGENAIMLYTSSTPEGLPSAATGRRKSTPPWPNLSEEVVQNSSGADLFLVISGWHKTTAHGSVPWQQSVKRVVELADGNVFVGFEDSTDGDFNDIFCRVIRG